MGFLGMFNGEKPRKKNSERVVVMKSTGGETAEIVKTPEGEEFRTFNGEKEKLPQMSNVIPFEKPK